MSDQSIFLEKRWIHHHLPPDSDGDRLSHTRVTRPIVRRQSRFRRRQQSAVRLLHQLAAIRLQWSDQCLLERLPPHHGGSPHLAAIRNGEPRNADFRLHRSLNRSTPPARQLRRHRGQTGEAGLKLWALDWELIEERHRGN